MCLHIQNMGHFYVPDGKMQFNVLSTLFKLRLINFKNFAYVGRHSYIHTFQRNLSVLSWVIFHLKSVNSSFFCSLYYVKYEFRQNWCINMYMYPFKVFYSDELVTSLLGSMTILHGWFLVFELHFGCTSESPESQHATSHILCKI